jgi:ABC-type transport system substrate-binding protein
MELLAPGPGYDPLRATYSLFIEEWANDLGMTVTANPTGFSVIVDQVFATGDAASEWDMYILGWGLTPFPDHVFSFFESAQDSANGGFNTPGYSNPEFDALSEQFATAKTLEEARQLIFQADAIIAEDLPYVVLFTTPIIEAYRNTIEFPFTTVLDGLQNFNGVPTSVTSA